MARQPVLRKALGKSQPAAAMPANPATKEEFKRRVVRLSATPASANVKTKPNKALERIHPQTKKCKQKGKEAQVADREPKDRSGKMKKPKMRGVQPQIKQEEKKPSLMTTA